MLTGRKRIVLVDIASAQDRETGDRRKRIVRAKSLVGKVELVGINTAQLGQVQGFQLVFSVHVPRIRYESEKFMYFDAALFEIKSFGKAKEETDMLLNVQRVEDKEAAAAVKEWIDENL